MVGMIGRGAQDLNLQDSSSGTCMTFDTVVHELLHAVGLYHEQSRYDRDGYITVQYANIEPGTVRTVRLKLFGTNTNSF